MATKSPKSPLICTGVTPIVLVKINAERFLDPKDSPRGSLRLTSSGQILLDDEKKDDAFTVEAQLKLEGVGDGNEVAFTVTCTYQIRAQLEGVHSLSEEELEQVAEVFIERMHDAAERQCGDLVGEMGFPIKRIPFSGELAIHLRPPSRVKRKTK